MDKQTLKSEKRLLLGKKVKNLRREGKLPANIFGKKVESQSIQLDRKEFESVFEEAGETGLIQLSLAGKDRPVLVHNVQLDPVSDETIHVDFVQVDLKEKITAQVPVELTGESPAEKQGVGTIVQYVDEVEVEALPTDFPENFLVDISTLGEVDQTVQLKDLNIDKNKIQINDDLEKIIVKVEAPQKEEAAPAPEEAEAVVEGDGAADEVEEQTPDSSGTQDKTE